MANSIVRLPVGYFPDPDKGRPLWNAKIYVGVIGLDPRTPANQKTVTGRQENGTEIPLAQPIRTSFGGVPVDDSGNVVTLLVDGAYSMAVDDNKTPANQKYYFANVLQGAPLTFDSLGTYATLTFNNTDDMKAGTLPDGSMVVQSIGDTARTKGYSVEGDGGGSLYITVAGGTGIDDAGIYFNKTDGSGFQSNLLYDNEINVKQFGATTLTGSDARLQAALDSGVPTITFNGEWTLTTVAFLDVSSSTELIGNTSIITNETLLFAGAFRVKAGATDVTIRNFDLRGPFYNVENLYSDRNIGINVTGRFDQFADSQPLTTPACERINIYDCVINGFGESGIITDNIIDLKVLRNTINLCGRDGLRAYGVKEGQISFNNVSNIGPGTSGIAPNFNVYGIELTMVYQLPIETFPRSERVLVSDNVIKNCYTWKSMGTHGGLYCTFANNICHNAHIGMGISQGKDVKTDFCKVIGNQFILEENPKTVARSGVAMFAGPTDPAGDSGESNHVIGNTIRGYGADAGDGAISISNQSSFQVSNNVIEDSLKAGITVIQPSDGDITNNTIRRVTADAFGSNFGISIQNVESSVNISGGTLDKGGLTMSGISLVFPDPGFTTTVSNDINFNCDVDIVQPNRINNGAYPVGAKGWALINVSAMVASLSNKAGVIATAVWQSTGVVRITFTKPFFATSSFVVEPTARFSTALMFGTSVIDTSTVDIYTYNTGGSLTDTGFKMSVSGY